MDNYPVADAHVDVLYRMDTDGASFYADISGDSMLSLQASAANLEAGNVVSQVFALFVPPKLPGAAQLETVLRCIDLFEQSVVRNGRLRAVRTIADLEGAHRNREIAGLLSLEGGGCLRGQASILRMLYHLGVRGMGLTWNPANELADGCDEPRGGGLTKAGCDIVREMARLGMWVDIAHLGDAGVTDVFRIFDGPVMASHANARAIHRHQRNLTDAMIKEIIHRNGWIGLTFEGSFVADPRDASVEGVLRHLDHILDLGGEDTVGFGSDFDGSMNSIPGLTSSASYAAFAPLLVERYGSALTHKILHTNFHRFLQLVLR